jgi:transposase-like protein
MTKAIARDPIYRRRRFQPEVIELCVRWYLTYRLSYRDLVEMMAERSVTVSHSTILRSVQRYVPEYERRWARFAQPINSSWRMDETAVSVRGGRHYLYRAVDRYGKSVHSLLCRDRSLESAQAFFREAVAGEGASWPTKINLDGNAATHRGLRMLGDEDSRWQAVEIRTRRYLNNIVEQDHRAIKRRCVSMLGLKSYRSAATTFAGIELAHRIRKGQFSVPVVGQGRTSTLKDLWNRALECSFGLAGQSGGQIPSMHQISASPCPRGATRVPQPGGRRCPRKIFFG